MKHLAVCSAMSTAFVLNSGARRQETESQTSNTFSLGDWQWKSFGDKIDHNEMK
jgi:hypothetical protein